MSPTPATTTPPAEVSEADVESAARVAWDVMEARSSHDPRFREKWEDISEHSTVREMMRAIARAVLAHDRARRAPVPGCPHECRDSVVCGPHCLKSAPARPTGAPPWQSAGEAVEWDGSGWANVGTLRLHVWESTARRFTWAAKYLHSDGWEPTEAAAKAAAVAFARRVTVPDDGVLFTARAAIDAERGTRQESRADTVRRIVAERDAARAQCDELRREASLLPPVDHAECGETHAGLERRARTAEGEANALRVDVRNMDAIIAGHRNDKAALDRCVTARDATITKLEADVARLTRELADANTRRPVRPRR